MTNHTIAHETIWTDHPRAEQRLNPFSPLSIEVLGIDPTPDLFGFTLDNHRIYRPRQRSKNAFEQARSLALTGRR